MSVYHMVPCSDDECRSSASCRRRAASFCLHMRFNRFLVIIRHGLEPFARHAMPSFSLLARG